MAINHNHKMSAINHDKNEKLNQIRVLETTCLLCLASRWSIKTNKPEEKVSVVENKLLNNSCAAVEIGMKFTPR
jgi:hypothetical protein